MQTRAIKNEKIEFLYSNQVIEAIGDKTLKQIKIKSNKNQEESIIDCNGLFLELVMANV